MSDEFEKKMKKCNSMVVVRKLAAQEAETSRALGVVAPVDVGVVANVGVPPDVVATTNVAAPIDIATRTVVDDNVIGPPALIASLALST